MSLNGYLVVGVLSMANGHCYISPLITTPQRRLTVPRLGRVGIQGVRLEVWGAAFTVEQCSDPSDRALIAVLERGFDQARGVERPP
jgi:hypothetical protein